MIIPGGAEWVGPFECTLTEGLTDQFKWDIFLDCWLQVGRKVGQILGATTCDGIAGIHFQMIAPLGRVGLLPRLSRSSQSTTRIPRRCHSGNTLLM